MDIKLFLPQIDPVLSPRGGDYVLLFESTKLVLTLGKEIPIFDELPSCEKKRGDFLFLGSLGEKRVFAGMASEENDWQREDLIYFYHAINEDWFSFLGYSFQILCWNRNHKYCGRCGKPTLLSSRERSRICKSCEIFFYPRINPAVVVAVIKDDSILLAQGVQFPNSFFSVLAGYVEPGETLEECVRREVREEAGIEIKNIQYFGSQSWSHSCSLMIGYTAEYADGELSLEPEELVAGGWFTRTALPAIPSKATLSRRLIDWYVTGEKSRNSSHP